MKTQVIKRLEPETVAAIVGNIVSVVGVVLCNKYVISEGFRFTMVLSGIHFFVTWMGCHTLLALGFFTYKPNPLKNVLPVALVSIQLQYP